MTTINVIDRSTKEIVRQFAIEGKDPCNVAGMNDMLEERLNGVT